MFVNGDLKGKFIMDRNLGARDTNFPEEAKGVLHYQFGRKDPFTGGSTNNSSVTTGYVGDTDKIWETEGVTAEPDGVDASAAINNPLIYFFRSTTGTNWCAGIDSERIVWHDYEVSVDSNGKSLFDPSPYGWKVPHIETWSNFSTLTMTAWNSDSPGRSYPNSETTDAFAYYPANGSRYANGSAIKDSSTRMDMWSSTPYTTLTSYSFILNINNVWPALTNYGRAGARTIRPVQHDEE